MKKVVVTGGAGFLGSHLSAALVKRGYEVHVVDTMVGAMPGRVLDPKAHLHKIDIRNKKALSALFKKIGPIAGVFHLAALPRVQFSIDTPEEAHDVNVNGTFTVLLVAKEYGVGKVVYSASSAAYGDQAKLPLSEDMVPHPKSPYALHKYIGEHYAHIFNVVYGLPTVSLRYFNIYGPGADPNGPYAQAIIKFIHLRKANKPLTITGDGKQTRDSVHVRDVVRANIMAFESKKVGKGEVINIGSGRNASVNEIAKMIGGKTVHIAPRIEPRHTKADIRKAKKLLKWEPTITLKEGIAELKEIAGLV
jgi:UDP-glucose 4-epimerase